MFLQQENSIWRVCSPNLKVKCRGLLIFYPRSTSFIVKLCSVKKSQNDLKTHLNLVHLYITWQVWHDTIYNQICIGKFHFFSKSHFNCHSSISNLPNCYLANFCLFRFIHSYFSLFKVNNFASSSIKLKVS